MINMTTLLIPTFSLAKDRLKIIIQLSLGLSFFSVGLPGLYAQGSLTPPGAPAATMKSLAQIEPRTPIAAAAFTISAPGSYYLTTNLTGVVGFNGITIASGNVILDLAGFTLTGSAGSPNGVMIQDSVTNVTVSNGSLSGWSSTGVSVLSSSSRNIVLDRLNISDSGSYGISVNGGVTVSSCNVQVCGVGISANNSTIFDCRVEDCTFYGVYVRSSTVSRCRIKNNAHFGIFVDFPGCLISDNVCTGNNTVNSTNYAGISINDSNNRIENNFLHGNGSSGAGIAVNPTYSGNIIIRNSVAGNGVNNYVIPAGQVVGPLITTTGTITSSNPWANFSF